MAETPNKLVRASITNQAAQQVEQINRALDEIDKGVRGTAFVELYDSDTTIDEEDAQSIMIRMTGTATSPVKVTIPANTDVSMPYLLWNLTAGHQEIEVQCGEGASVMVPNGKLISAWKDHEDNLYRYSGDEGGGGGGGGDVTLDGTQTLTNKTLIAPVIHNPTGFLSGAKKITVDTSPPGSPGVGDIWVDVS